MEFDPERPIHNFFGCLIRQFFITKKKWTKDVFPLLDSFTRSLREQETYSSCIKCDSFAVLIFLMFHWNKNETKTMRATINVHCYWNCCLWNGLLLSFCTNYLRTHKSVCVVCDWFYLNINASHIRVCVFECVKKILSFLWLH